jgi:lipopolysaccharide exporter
MEALFRKVAKGAAWMVLVRLTERFLGLASTMVLARLLVPEDFGLVALAASLFGLLEIMGAFGFELALIQNQRAERQHYDTAWTLNVSYGLASGLVLASIAPAAGRFFGDPRLEGILYVFAACAVLQSFKNIGVVAFQKDLDFRREFLFLFLKKLTSVCATLYLAFTLQNYWALAIGSLISALIGVALSYGMHPFRPRFELSCWRQLMRFSGWVLFSNVVVFAGNRGYELLIGRISGVESVGLYSVANEIANLPTTEIAWPVSKAIFPGFSRMAADAEGLRKSFLATASTIALVTIPAGAGVAMLADPLVRLLLGAKWLPAVPLIQILAIFGVLRAMHAGTGALYLALGKTRFIVWVAMPHVVFGLPAAMVLLTTSGLQGATYAVLAAGAVALTLSLGIARTLLALRLSEIAACFARPIVATTAMAAALHWHHWDPGLHADTLGLIASTSLLVAGGGAVYVSCLLLFWYCAGKPAGAESILLSRAMLVCNRKRLRLR